MVDLSEFKNLYIETAKENIEELKEGLSLLSRQTENKDAIERIHRASHTLKSKSLVMRYTNIGNLSKAIEDIFYQIKQGKNKVSLALLTALHDIVGHMELAIQNVQSQNKDVDLSDDIKRLNKIMV